MPTDAIEAGTKADVSSVARLHHGQLSESFLSTLGEPFLRVLYRRIVLDPRSTLIVARRGLDVVGFIAGTEDTGQLYRSFARRDAVRAAVVSAPRLLRHARTAVETLRYGGGPGAGTDRVDLPPAELLSLAVDPRARRLGLGGRLIGALHLDLAARGVTRVRVTVASDNAAAITAYQRSGYVTATVIEVHRGHSSEVLVWG